MQTPRRFCMRCGSALDADGGCPNGHPQGEAPAARDGGGIPQVGASVALAWRLLVRQPALLWIPLEASVIVLAWMAGLAGVTAIAATGARSQGANAFNALTGGYALRRAGPSLMYHLPLIGRLAASPVASGGAAGLVLVWMLAGLLVAVPYVIAGTMRGLIRALDGRALASAFWSDGVAYFGRSYLAFVAGAIVGIVPVLVAVLWSILWFRVGHGIGPVLGVLGDIVVAVGTIPFVSLVGAAVFQSGWDGFGRSIALVRRRWVSAMGLLIVLALIGGVTSGIGTLLYAIPVLGWAAGTALSWAAGLFSLAGVLLYYRAGVGVAAGDWSAGPALTAAGVEGPTASVSAPRTAASADIDWNAARSWLPRWGALLRPDVQDALPAFLGSPREGLATLGAIVRPDEAAALSADAFALFGAALGGVDRPFWGWLVGGVVGFAFGVVWTRLVAIGAHAALQDQEGPPAPSRQETAHLLALSYLLPACLAVVDFVLAMLTPRLPVVSVMLLPPERLGAIMYLPLASLVGILPFSVAAVQIRGATGWRSVFFGVGIVLAVLIPWLILQSLLLRIR